MDLPFRALAILHDLKAVSLETHHSDVQPGTSVVDPANSHGWSRDVRFQYVAVEAWLVACDILEIETGKESGQQ